MRRIFSLLIVFFMAPTFVSAATKHPLASKYNMFIFYASYCPYSRAMAPKVVKFAKKHGFKLLAFSVNGHKLPDFAKLDENKELYEKLGVSSIPVVGIISKYTPDYKMLVEGESTTDLLLYKLNHLK